MASITDELRAWFKDRMFMGNGWREIRDIADRIDEAHERELRETGEDIVRDVRREWVRLPLDADGVPICVGDVMECGDGTVFTVESISLHPFGWRCSGDGIDGSGYKCTAHPLPHSCRHHRTPTVEDVLREFGEKMGENKSRYVSDVWDMDEWCAADRDTIAEFVKRLQLREGE